MSQLPLLLCSQDNALLVPLLQHANLPNLRLLCPKSSQEELALASEAKILLGEPARIKALLPHAKKLVWAQSTYAGIELLCDPALRRDYLLTNVRGIFGGLMSEYVFGYLLSITRQFAQYRQQQHDHLWQRIPYQSLAGHKMLILGTGDIGQQIAKTALHFGMEVIGINRSGRECAPFSETYQLSALDRLLPNADVVVSVLPETRETKGLFNLERFNRCKPSAIFFNVGRGSAVVTQDLLTALQRGVLAHAVVDVFAEEPLPANSPLWAQPNLIITPHHSAYSFPESIATIFSRNYYRYIQGQALEFRVNFENGY